MELLRDKIHKDAYMVTKLMNMLKRGELRLDHPLQRDADQWNVATRDGFIATLIKDEDVDSIKICEQLGDNGVTLWLIDGKQRVTTMQMYRNNAFKLGKNIEFPIIKYQVAQTDENGKLLKDENGELVYDIVDYDICGKGYGDLPDELKERIDNYKVNVVKHLNCIDEEVGYHMRRYNRQTSLNSAQDSITFMDNTAKFVKDIASNSDFFKNCGSYTETEKKKGIADRVVVESIMSAFHMDDWKKNSKKMGAYVNENASKQEFETLKDELARLAKVITEPIELFNSKNTFIWLALFHGFTSYNIDDSKFVDFLKEFTSSLHSKQIDGQSFDDLNINKATKDKKVVEEKLHMLSVLMNEYLHSNIVITEKCEEETVNNTLDSDADVLKFIKVNVNPDVTEEDIDYFKDNLESLTARVDNNTKLLDEQNMKSLLGMMAYSDLTDKDLDEWFISFFEQYNDYYEDQSLNLGSMINDFENYLQCKAQTA